MLKLVLGLNLNPDDIEEGDDVYFECKVHANPWAYKVVWKHNVSMSYLIIYTEGEDNVWRSWEYTVVGDPELHHIEHCVNDYYTRIQLGGRGRGLDVSG